jgi:protein-L-isoaspartate(D-aspartate) O-methyltransferase
MIPVLVPLLLGLLTACRPNLPPDSVPTHRAAREDPYAAERARMVQEQLRARGIRDPAVLAAMARVPRHQFVPSSQQHLAYRDHPLPIGLDQTISQPYIVAYMTEAAAISPGENVLEIGTGSGYQAAILAELAREVYTIEILPELATGARSLLRRLGYTNVQVRTGDGYGGWKEHAPFDAILVTAAPDHVPPALVEQLAVNGRMVIPVGADEQVMRVLTRTAEGVIEEDLLPVRFVPLVRPDTAGRRTPVRR